MIKVGDVYGGWDPGSKGGRKSEGAGRRESGKIHGVAETRQNSKKKNALEVGAIVERQELRVRDTQSAKF